MAGGYRPTTQLSDIDPKLLRDLRTSYDLTYNLQAQVEGLMQEVAQLRKQLTQTAGSTSASGAPLSGNGSPEGRVVAPPGQLYVNLQGGAAVTLYVKESGQGSTGWVAK